MPKRILAAYCSTIKLHTQYAFAFEMYFKDVFTSTFKCL